MRQQYEQRIIETKKKIFNAFVDMMKDTSIHQISISELCKKAGINRTTFYNHFGSQYDVLNEIIDLYLHELEEMLHNVCIDDIEGVEKRVELCFEFALKHKDVTKMLIENTNGTDFASRLFALPKIEKLFNEKLSTIQDENEKKAYISFITYGSYQLLCEWLNHPDRMDARDEAKLVLKLARKVCA